MGTQHNETKAQTSYTHPTLPDFSKPPVIEVALAVQFDLLSSLQTPHIGILWSNFRPTFPRVEQHPPRNSVIEKFGVRKPDKATVTFGMGIPVPRCWFLNETGTELIQVQQDCFVHNWRKGSEVDEYPHYRYIREKFELELNTFRQFIRNENLGEFIPNQCEVTYVNHIVLGEGWENHGQLDEVITVWSPHYSDDFLSKPEGVRFAVRYVIPDKTGAPLGRLHVSIEPGYRTIDEKPIFILRLTARGRPDGEGSEGVFRFLDRGHEWIVRGFASITTQRMHKIWGRLDVP